MLLVDAEWAAPEPEPVAAEPVAVGAVADVLLEEPGERQRSLFSRAEFLGGEPEEPPKRRRRDEAPTLSVLEWALEREQEGALAGRPRPCVGVFRR